MDYALFLVEYLNNNLKVTPSRTLFSKIIKACARNALNPFVKQILILVKNINKDKSRFNSLFHNEYLNGLYFLTENVNTGITRDSLTNSSLLKKFCGTREYIAPEIFEEKGFNEKVDIWAAGILMFNMLTGCDPLNNENDSDYRDNILYKEINFSLIKN